MIRAVCGFLVAFLLLVLAPFSVHAASCDTTPFFASGYFFSSYENVSYSPDGYLEYHFKVNLPFTDGRSFKIVWSFKDDECNNSDVSGNQKFISLPIGVTDWSIRFSSTTHF